MARKLNPSKCVLCFVFFHCVCIFLFLEMAIAQTIAKVGVIVYDYDGWVGNMWLSCINMSLVDFYANHGHYKTRMVLHTRNSNGDVIGAAAAALNLVKNVEVQAIIGPTTSMEANFVIELGEKAQVPIISFSASSPSLTSLRNPYFFQATQNDKTQVNAITAIVQAFGWKQAVPIYVDNEYGIGIIPYLMEALQAVDTRVSYQSAISPSASDDQILKELFKLMTMQTRVFIVHMLPSLGARLFTKAKEIGMMNAGYVWIMTDAMTNLLSSLDRSVIDSMQGALGVKPYVLATEELESFRVRWKKKFYQDHPDLVDAELNVYGLWAYDATRALAMAIEEAGTTTFSFQKRNVSSNLTDLDNLGISRNGAALVQALSKTSFKGLAGDFLFVNQQLQKAPAFQIVNVNDAGARGIGFWTPVNGLVKNLKFTEKSTSTFNKSNNLATIIWPGDPTIVPKGWEVPTNGKRMQIGVPVKIGFTTLVNVTRDPATNITKVTGYCIDIFEAAVKELPYAVAYDYIPFANAEGKAAGTYNDLVYQVFLGKYDAVVGDTSIIANRTLYVDFTLPFTDSHVSMLVRTKEKKKSSAVIFLKPLSSDLWAITFLSFLFVGFVVWVLEHRRNEDFQGSAYYQVGTSLWFSFSTMVFAHRERVFNNWARLVVIVWSFVMLILTQSYTASLASLLTVKRLEPEISDVTELIRNGDLVGYLHGSFVYGILKNLGFQDNQLVAYESPEELHKLFSERTGKSPALAAAFDTSPYMRLILARYCSDYILVEAPTFMLKMPGRNTQQFKTDGFGFVFPKGSPLARDMSRAIVKVLQGDEMRRIEDAWFGEQSKCPDRSSSISSSVLDLDSFWGLFAIAGGVSAAGFLSYIAMFFHENWHILVASDSDASLRSKMLMLLKEFSKKEPKVHNPRKGEVNVGSCTCAARNGGAPNACDAAPDGANESVLQADHNSERVGQNSDGQTGHGGRVQNSESSNQPMSTFNIIKAENN